MARKSYSLFIKKILSDQQSTEAEEDGLIENEDDLIED